MKNEIQFEQMAEVISFEQARKRRRKPVIKRSKKKADKKKDINLSMLKHNINVSMDLLTEVMLNLM